MKTTKKYQFGDVCGFELGFSKVGQPLMTVYCFVAGNILIDTGQSHMRKTVLDIARKHQICAVLLTHHHEDHSGNAAAIRQEFDIPVMAHSLTINKMRHSYKIFPYQHWVWGATTPVILDSFSSDFYAYKNLKFQPIHTPGHSKDHTVFLEINNGWLFSGDLYLGDRIKYFRADEKIYEQIRSLKNIMAYDFNALFCCHNPRPENGKKHLAAKLQFLEDFYGQVSILADQGLDDKTIMRQLHLKEQQMIKLICFGNVSMRNMVRSVINARQGD
jgi:glyoxylase-like metal-dependent hydrolase (beta-lactamase superfamily II)